MATPALTNPYSKSAQTKFDSLMAFMKSSEPAIRARAENPKAPWPPYQFWQLGNAFDTMIDYLDTVDPSSAVDVTEIMLRQYGLTLKVVGGYGNAWFDDFGWWTIATNRALEKSFFSSTDKDQFRGFMSECWKHFTENAPYVWERCHSDRFKDYAPAVKEGVWNEYWLDTPSSFPGPKNGDPTHKIDPVNDPGLWGIQNTVTNALYLIAAQRLGITDDKARKAAEGESRFLNDMPPDQNPLWWQPKPESKNEFLVRERVSHFLNGEPDSKFQEEWAWTGDQGLILGGLVDGMRLISGGPDERKTRKTRETLLNRAKQLLAGTRKNLVDSSSGALKNWTITGDTVDEDDYKTGAGVFWRNLLHAWNHAPELRDFLMQNEYQQFVKASAVDAARSSPGSDIQTLTNEVAALVAASVVLQ